MTRFCTTPMAMRMSVRRKKKKKEECSAEPDPAV